VLSFTTVSFAEGKRAGTKLERGVKNVALGWTEIPKNIVDTSKKQNFVVGLTIGTIKGVLNAFARTVSGAADVATFPSGTYDRPSIKPSMTGESAPAAKAK
jgi:putative exosortase-associated protein (TIGR04073 family)